MRAGERHELAVLQLVVHAVEARGHAVGARRVADDEDVRRELLRAQPQVVDAAVPDHDLGRARGRRGVRAHAAVTSGPALMGW